MQHLFDDWNNLKNRIKARNTFLLLDYGGTLTPIKKIPGAAILSIKTRKLLEALSNLNNCKVVLISGRSIRDLRQLTQCKNAAYIGTHGFETQDARMNYNAELDKDVKYALWSVCKSLRERLGNITGLIVEDKKYAIAIHYRLVQPFYLQKIKNCARKIVNEFSSPGQLTMYNSKNSIEIRPAGHWNKGWATSRILEKYSDFMPVCIGDDFTDEDMFASCKGTGINIRVGRCIGSNAEFYLDNVSEVQHFLNCVLDIKKEN